MVNFSVPALQMGQQAGHRVNGWELTRRGLPQAALPAAAAPRWAGGVPSLLPASLPSQAWGRPLYIHKGSGDTKGHSRQEPVNVSCQKQIAVFPAGLAKPSFWRSATGELGLVPWGCRGAILPSRAGG